MTRTLLRLMLGTSLALLASPSPLLDYYAPGSPSAPVAASAAPGNGNATLHWHIPTNNGNGPITGYVVTPYITFVPQPPRASSGRTSSDARAIGSLTVHRIRHTWDPRRAFSPWLASIAARILRSWRAVTDRTWQASPRCRADATRRADATPAAPPRCADCWQNARSRKDQRSPL